MHTQIKDANHYHKAQLDGNFRSQIVHTFTQLISMDCLYVTLSYFPYDKYKLFFLESSFDQIGSVQATTSKYYISGTCSK